MRKEYEMTEEQYASMCVKPLPYMVFGGVDPIALNQELANSRWVRLGEELGFVWDTAEPIAGKGPRWFSAVVKA